MIGEFGNGQNTIGLAEGSMDIQEKLHKAAISVCDLAFAIAGQREDFNKRFVELGYNSDGTDMDYLYLTYDLEDGDRLEVYPAIGAEYHLEVKGPKSQRKSGQVLHSGPSTMPPEIKELEGNRAEHMEVAELFKMLNVIATCVPRVP